jgi:tRNA (guanine-N7-)-methyltransferase
MMNKHYLSLEPFVFWRQEKRPLDWDEKFGRAAELELEIGFGLGDFLVRRAQALPHINFVGIELRWHLVRLALRKIALAGLANVRVLQVDARLALERVFAEESLNRVRALFPCPWPKERHVKHRLFSTPFLRLLNSRLKTMGEAIITTDHRPFFEWVQSQLPTAGFDARPVFISPQSRTKYERKWQERGQERFYELCLTKYRHVEIPAKEERHLRTYAVTRFDPEHFRPENQHDKIIVEFREIMYDPRREKALVRCLVVEENFAQNIWIEITKKGQRWVIRPAQGSCFVPTAGAQLALDGVRDAIGA